MPEETLTDFKCDAVCVGERELTLMELIRGGKKQDFSLVKGLCYLMGQTPVFSRPRDLIQNLDILPFPARHFFNETDIVMSNRLSNSTLRMTHIMISRGCPFSCYFCATSQTIPRYRSGKNVRSELEYLIRRYGIQGFAIVDDNFIVNKKKVTEICDVIADLELKWSALSRVDTVNQKLLERMKTAGCLEIKFGVESGSETILRAMNKNITREMIMMAITTAYALGINVKVFFMHGFPGENTETTRETIYLLERLRPMILRVSLFRFTPLPGSHIYEHHKDYDIRGTKYDADWDGDWSKYHIHHNYHHWWGNKNQFEALQEAYDELSRFVITNWP